MLTMFAIVAAFGLALVTVAVLPQAIAFDIPNTNKDVAYHPHLNPEIHHP
jgi:hypothetical protein